MRWTWIAVAGVVVALPVATADANPLGVFGYGARGAAMGGALTAAADDYSAVFYNLAALTVAKPGIGVGFTAAYDDVHIRLKDRPAGYDLPDLGNASAAIPSKYRLNQRGDTNDIPNTYGMHIGAVGSLGLDRLRVGVGVFLPVDHVAVQNSHFPDEREQYFSNRLDFELLGQRVQHQVIMAGAAYRLTNWLGVGIGLSFLPKSTTQSTVYLADSTKQDQIQLGMNNTQNSHLSPNIGLLLTPTDALQFGFAWRGENFFELDVQNQIQIKGFQNSSGSFPIVQTSRIVVNYTPHELALGTSWHNESLLLSGDVIYALWSRYLNQQGQQPGNWHDALSPRLGLQWQVKEDRKLYMGLRYDPSPVPAQTGRTNYVDNDRTVLSVGAHHALRLFDRDLEFGWALQWHHLLARDTNKATSSSYPACTPSSSQICDEIADDTKDASTGKAVAAYQGLQTGNPGFPGFSSYGDLLALSVDLRWLF